MSISDKEQADNTNTADEWNATLNGNYLWSNVNFGEAVTEVMTPLTWSVIQFTLDDWVFLPGYPTVGNIGGRPYLNISIFATLFHAMGRNRQDLLNYMESTLYMRLPEDMDIPQVPVSRLDSFTGFVYAGLVQFKQNRGLRRAPGYLDTDPDWFEQICERIQAQDNKSSLFALWHDEIRSHIEEGVWCVLGSTTGSANYTLNLRRQLSRLVGPDDANILIANLSDGTGFLESLGPLAGLEKLSRGAMSRSSYLAQYGHRGPHEFELSVPRPAEDPQWIDQVLDNFRRSPVDVTGLVAKQARNFDEAWERFRSRHPRASRPLQRKLAESARLARQREHARSAYIRDRWAIRLFALQAGRLADIGDDIFFLSLDEVLALLYGDNSVKQAIPTRKDAYHRYKALPSYPPVIVGQFDPFKWAADPHRSTDIYSAQSDPFKKEELEVVSGSPGSAGRVEGIVRIIENPESGYQLKQGEILVAVQTDITWTLLFPRAVAVITDVGAPLSHAAIVARELGIPAVVGCGNATKVLNTGDRVRVDGAKGIVEILDC